MRFPVVLFDLDGTLIDSGPMIMASARYAARDVLGIEPAHVDELVASYREENERLHDGLEAFDAVLDVLLRFQAEGRRLGIVTAKRRSTVELAFARFPVLERASDVLVSAEDTVRHKPDPAPILVALDRLSASPSEAAYVGDSPFDVQAARAAGTFAVAVAWGGIHSGERLAVEEPDVLVEAPRELLDVL
jgi:pyrophosphatase PpaX